MRRPVAYFSKKLDIVTVGLAYVWAVAATCDLFQEAEKFTLRQPTTVHTSHCVLPLLEQKGYWLMSGRLGKYQAILLDNPNVILKSVSTLNPAMLLPTSNDEHLHTCIQVIEQVYSSPPDLTDIPLKDPNLETLIISRINFMDHSKQKANPSTNLGSQSLFARYLHAKGFNILIQALYLGKKNRLIVHSDSKYAFSTVHAHGNIWKERGLFTLGRGRDILRKFWIYLRQ